MCHSARFYNCARCQQQIKICSHCDRGNIYCPEGCSEQSRYEKQKEAALRYQSSPKGRLLHAKRQQQYRQRQREKVTHQGSPALIVYDLLITEQKVIINRPKISFLTKIKGMVCHFCGRQCSELLRWSFLHRQNGLALAISAL